MEICAADSNIGRFDFDLAITADRSRYVVFDLDLFFAIKSRGSHGLARGIGGNHAWNCWHCVLLLRESRGTTRAR